MWKCLSSLLLLTCSVSTWAERPLLSGALGAWLQQTATPELVDVLGNHPKFKGERIHFAAMQGGALVQQSNRLTIAIEQYLTREILRAGNNDVAWRRARQACNVAAQPSQYLVGIEVSPAGPRNHQLDVKILDTEEGVWVRGVSLAWAGRLLTSEQRALAAVVNEADAGSLSNPLPLREADKVAAHLTAQIECALTHPLAGGVLVTPAEDSQMQAVTVAFEQQMAVRTHMNLTREPGAAQWRLQAALAPARFGAQQLTLRLLPEQTEHDTQLLAVMFVLADTPPAPLAPSDPVIAAPAPAAALLSPLRLGAKKACPRGTSGHCMEVSFELEQDAYVSVFHTLNARLEPADCDARAARRAPGTQIYRITLASEARTGIYAIASRERSVMRALLRQLRKAPGGCSDTPAGSHGSWLRETLALIDRHRQDLSWRAVHVGETNPAAREI